MANDVLLCTRAGKNSRNNYRPNKAAQNSKIKFLNYDDGKGEGNKEYSNEVSVSNSEQHYLANSRFLPNQGIPKFVSSQSLEETRNIPLEERMRCCCQNRTSRKVFQSKTTPSSNLNFKIGQGSSDDKWKFLRGGTSTLNFKSTQTTPSTPTRKLLGLGKCEQGMSSKSKTTENVSWMSKRGGVLMQGRSDIKKASDLIATEAQKRLCNRMVVKEVKTVLRASIW